VGNSPCLFTLSSANLAVTEAAQAAGRPCAVGSTPERCEAHLQSLNERLEQSSESLQGSLSALQTMESLRQAIISGRPIELESATRQYLEANNPIVADFTYDLRHRPVSTNFTGFFLNPRTVGGHLQVVQHTILSVSPSSKKAENLLVAVVDSSSLLWIFDLWGRVLVEGFDLGHAEGVLVERIVASTEMDPPILVTTDNTNRVKVHSLKIDPSAPATVSGVDDGVAEYDPPTSPRLALALPRLACAFKLPAPPHFDTDRRDLTSMAIVESGGQTHFVASDTAGGITVFTHRGFLRGRIKITNEVGGVRGLFQYQGNNVFWFSGHEFGLLNVPLLDLTHPPCLGPKSGIVHGMTDPSYSLSRVFLALEDGDVIVIKTQREDSISCRIQRKLPHVSNIPFEFHAFRGYTLGIPKLPKPATNATNKEAQRPFPKMLFFSITALEKGYGTSPSRSIHMQADFPDSEGPLSVAFMPDSGFNQEKGVTLPMVLHFPSKRGVDIYDVALRPAPRSFVSSKDGAPDEDTIWVRRVVIAAVVMMLAVLFPIWWWQRRCALADIEARKKADEEQRKREAKEKEEELKKQQEKQQQQQQQQEQEETQYRRPSREPARQDYYGDYQHHKDHHQQQYQQYQQEQQQHQQHQQNYPDVPPRRSPRDTQTRGVGAGVSWDEEDYDIGTRPNARRRPQASPQVEELSSDEED